MSEDRGLIGVREDRGLIGVREDRGLIGVRERGQRVSGVGEGEGGVTCS